jgi:tetratricopeptide (TPR) repeat protein
MPGDETIAQFREIKRLDARGMVCCTVELARRYLAAHPKHGVVWLYYADSLYRMARYTEALAALRHALRLCPPKKLHLVYYRLGRLHQQKGALRLAERWYRRAVDSSPSDATYRIFLGAFLARAGRLREAEAVHRGATRCKEGCIDEAFLNLGLVLRALERYSDARKCFQRALDIDPKYKAARKELSDVEAVIELKRNG